jgi:hypothetical protein
LEQQLSLLLQSQQHYEAGDEDMDDDGDAEDDEEPASETNQDLPGEEFGNEDAQLDNGLLQQYEHVMNFG